MGKRVAAAALWIALALVGTVAGADGLPGQGQPCTPSKSCAAKLRCVARKDAQATCERTCSANADCAADQRCVKDAGVMMCRAISDEDMDYKRPSF